MTEEIKLMTCTKLCTGPLAKGCEQCIVGRKSVIFVTGLCHYKCFYCPISDDKRNKDIVKINEHIIINPDEQEGLNQLFAEIENCQSLGASLTGGDPLAKLDRTIYYIKALKEKFGKGFHIHLYSSLPFVTQDAMIRLSEAGLDEIRFHADLDDIASWEKMYFAEGLKMNIGIEIPSIPGSIEKTKELINFAKKTGFIEFVNLNELEFSDISNDNFEEHGFFVKNSLSYGIMGSEAVAKEAIEYAKNIGMPTHYCTAGFKDKVQLANRLRLRSQKVAKEYDLEDEEGLLERGEILPLTDKENSSSEMVVEGGLDLEAIKQELQEEFEIPDELIDNVGYRLLIAPWVIKEIFEELNERKEEFTWIEDVEISIVKEYPTDDHFLVERNPL